MTKLINALNNIFERIENDKTDFLFWAFAFFSVVILRNLAEDLLETPQTVFGFQELFVYYLLEWVFVFLSYSLILAVFAKQKITSAAKITIAFFPIIILVPAIDFVISGGKGYDLQYVLGNPNHLLSMFLSFGNGFSQSVVSYGQKTVFLVSVVIACAYCWVKTKSISRTVGLIAALYILIWFFAAMPSFLGMEIYGITGWEQLTANSGILTPDKIFNKPTVFFSFAAIIMIEAGLFLFLWNRKKFFALIKNIRLTRLAHYVFFMAILGAIAFHIAHPEQEINWLRIIMLLVSGFFAFQASVAINDLSDLGIDKINNKNRPLAKNSLNEQEYKKIAVIEIMMALVTAIIAGYAVFTLVLCALLLGSIYSMRPFRLKRFVGISTFALALVSLLLFLAGFFSAGGYYPREIPAGFILFVVLIVTLGFNAKDLKDIEGDKKAGVETIPVIFGEEKARKIIFVLIAISYLVTPVLLGLPLLFLMLAVVFAIVNYFLIIRLKKSEIILMVFYFIYFAPVMAYLAL